MRRAQRVRLSPSFGRLTRLNSAATRCRNVWRFSTGRLAAAAMTIFSPLSDKARGMAQAQGMEQVVPNAAVDLDDGPAAPEFQAFQDKDQIRGSHLFVHLVGF
jgi:hypothetical protein